MTDFIPSDIDTTEERMLVAAGVVLAILVAGRIVQSLATRRIDQADLRYRIRKVVTFSSYFLAIMAVFVVFRYNLGGFGVALGVAGAGIAFALQEVIASIAGWFAISFAGFYRTGDRVQLGGIKGDVIDIGILRTTIMEMGEWVSADLYNGRVVKVANSFVFKEPVYNYSGDFPFLWDEMMFPIKYGTDWKLARDVLTRVSHEVVDDYTASAQEAWRATTRRYRLEPTPLEPLVTIRPTDNWIEFRLRYIVDYRVRRRTQDEIAARFLEEVDRYGNRITFGSQTIEIVDGAPAITRPAGGAGHPNTA